MTAHTRLDPPLVESIRKALTGNALPGETQGLSREAEREAAEFITDVASKRKRGELAFFRPPGEISFGSRYTGRRFEIGSRHERRCALRCDQGRSAERHVDRQEPCRSCWARYLCGGGCYHEVERRGRIACDYIRDWLTFCIASYAEISAKAPLYFSEIPMEELIS